MPMTQAGAGAGAALSPFLALHTVAGRLLIAGNADELAVLFLPTPNNGLQRLSYFSRSGLWGWAM